MSNKKRVTVKLTGGDYYPNKYATILVRGKGYKDTPGVKYTVIRGVLECAPLHGKNTRRSIYGVKKLDKVYLEIKQKVKTFLSAPTNLGDA